MEIAEKYRQRFWCRVAIGEPEACWLWQGWRGKSGHGRFALSMGPSGVYNRGAHQLAWEITNGAIPHGMQVLHKRHCTSAACCNPWHLYLGTVAQNMADRRAAGKYSGSYVSWGGSNGNAKMDETRVLALLHMRADGASLQEIAQHFDIDLSQASHICRREQWSHVSFERELPLRVKRRRVAS